MVQSPARPMRNCLSGKSSRGQQSKFILLRIVPLHAPHFSAHQVDGCVKDALVKRAEIAFLNQQSAATADVRIPQRKPRLHD
jgi:hypothetical protein